MSHNTHMATAMMIIRRSCSDIGLDNDLLRLRSRKVVLEGYSQINNPNKGLGVIHHGAVSNCTPLYCGGHFASRKESTLDCIVNTTGLAYLPQTMKSSSVGQKDSYYAWIEPDSEEHVIFPLMRLRSGSLLNSARKSVEREIKISTMVVKAQVHFFGAKQYPPSIASGTNASEGAVCYAHNVCLYRNT